MRLPKSRTKQGSCSQSQTDREGVPIMYGGARRLLLFDSLRKRIRRPGAQNVSPARGAACIRTFTLSFGAIELLMVPIQQSGRRCYTLCGLEKKQALNTTQKNEISICLYVKRIFTYRTAPKAAIGELQVPLTAWPLGTTRDIPHV